VRVGSIDHYVGLRGEVYGAIDIGRAKDHVDMASESTPAIWPVGAESPDDGVV
jgi:predicted porin